MAVDHFVILCTVPDDNTAVLLGRQLVEEKLAACCNIVPAVRSIYQWEGDICDEAECLMLIKTRADIYERLEKRITELHPYEVPEILAVNVNRGFLNYLNWVDEHVDNQR